MIYVIETRINGKLYVFIYIYFVTLIKLKRYYMKYEIVHDSPNRLRIKCGRYAFAEYEGYGISRLISSLDSVTEVISSCENGSLLIKYADIKERINILKFIRNIKKSDVKEAEPNENEVLRQIDTEFQLSLAKMIVNRGVTKLFLPYPLKVLKVLYNSIPFIKEGLKSLWNFRMDVSLLDGVAIVGSMLMKSFSSAGSVIFWVSLAELLEDYTVKRTKSTLKNSLAINVDTVWLVMEDLDEIPGDGTDEGDVLTNCEKISEISVPLSSITKGDKIRIRTGNIIPVDGTIVKGDGMVNEASMTGESACVHKNPGKTVYAGTVVEEGSVIIEVKATDEETRINKIVDLIENSESLKAGVQSRAENLADSIVPLSLFLTAATYGLTRNSMRALSVLMVDYSCAIKLATPISVISAMEEASNHRIMIKGGKYLENFAEAKTIVFDKTGTLTKACPTVAKVIPCGKLPRDEVLRNSACLEEHFAHSVARAIVKQAEKENLKHEEHHAEVEYIVAHGISTTFKKKKALIGSAHFIFEDEKVPITKKQQKLIDENVNEYSTIFFAMDNKLEGIICIEDPIRIEAKEIIEELKDLGIENVIMLTGDSENAAYHVSKELGITDYQSQVLPEDKAEIIEQLKKESGKVIMVGDGINDSIALSAADVSVAMRDSSDIAREVADISLLSDDLYELVTLRILSQRMLNKITTNYNGIIAINTTLIALGILGIVSPATSSLAHNLSTVFIGALSTKNVLDEPIDV